MKDLSEQSRELYLRLLCAHENVDSPQGHLHFDLHYRLAHLLVRTFSPS